MHYSQIKYIHTHQELCIFQLYIYTNKIESVCLSVHPLYAHINYEPCRLLLWHTSGQGKVRVNANVLEVLVYFS